MIFSFLASTAQECMLEEHYSGHGEGKKKKKKHSILHTHRYNTSLVAQMVKSLSAMEETHV